MSSSPTILNNIKESILGLKNFVENGEINDAIDGGGIEEDDYAPLNSPKDYEYLSILEKLLFTYLFYLTIYFYQKMNNS